MEEEQKWFIFAVLFMLFGIYWIVYGATEKEVVFQSIGVCGIFVGFLLLIRLGMGYPQWFRNLKKRNKIIATLADLGSSIGGSVFGYLLFGPWGIAIGFIFISIMVEILVPFLIE